MTIDIFAIARSIAVASTTGAILIKYDSSHSQFCLWIAHVCAQSSIVVTMTNSLLDTTPASTPTAEPTGLQETPMPMMNESTTKAAFARASDHSSFVGSVNATQSGEEYQCLEQGHVAQWIWRVSKDSRVFAYAVGTNHLKTSDAVTDALLGRFKDLRQRRMFTELDLDAFGSIVERTRLRCVYLPTGTIYDTLTPATGSRLKSIIAQYAARRIPVGRIAEMRPLFVAGQLALLPEGTCGSSCGVDALFSRAACTSSEGLETLDEQCSAVNTDGLDLNRAWESAFLIDAIERAEQFLNGTVVFPSARLQSDYECGVLDKLLENGVRTCQADGRPVCDRMLSDRDRRFAQRLLCMFDNSSDAIGEPCSKVGLRYFQSIGEPIAFAIGIAHLIRRATEDANTVFDHLLRANYTIERVSPNETFNDTYQCPTHTPRAPSRGGFRPIDDFTGNMTANKRPTLSAGEIASIIIGTLCGVAIVAVLAIFAVRRWRAPQSNSFKVFA